MSLKGMLGKEILPAGDLTKPRGSVMGILTLAVAVMVVLAALAIGKYGYGKGRGLIGGLVPSVKDGGADLMAQLESL